VVLGSTLLGDPCGARPRGRGEMGLENEMGASGGAGNVSTGRRMCLIVEV